ncbi:hypothetical protein BDB00DRAFT_842355 [Zychaea mexicana]|uniref:uncharacterized protein n=1 Tax=Zychaea mexicana TaxID=64656 RepID=UPI0022FDE1DB|nr:uncharacterized protein BDB00DRAFT_842355 [Zychaea mexicana]KAI9489637.1 hypothetical protein BDB00DRAFT_842355 [Zychaea mexicana]
MLTTAMPATTFQQQQQSSNHHRSSSTYLPPRAPVVKRMVTVQDVSIQEEPMQGLLIIQSDSENDDDDDDDSYSMRTSPSPPATPATTEESYDTISNQDADDPPPTQAPGIDDDPTTIVKSRKPLPQIPSSFDLQQEGELLLVSTHLETIQESLDSTIEDDDDAMSRSYQIPSVMQQEDHRVQEEKTSVEPDLPLLTPPSAYNLGSIQNEDQQQQQQQPLTDSNNADTDASNHEQHMHQQPTRSLATLVARPLMSKAPSVESLSAVGAQKPFEPFTTTFATKVPATTAMMASSHQMQSPHTPEESKPATIWSVDTVLHTNDNDNDNDDVDDKLSQATSTISSMNDGASALFGLRRRVSKEELPDQPQQQQTLTVQTTVTALASSSASLCSRCSSSVGSGPSSATSIISNQEQQLRALAQPRLARPASVMSFSPRPSSMYGGGGGNNNDSPTNYHHQQPLSLNHHHQQQQPPFPFASRAAATPVTGEQEQQQQQQTQVLPAAPMPQSTSSSTSSLLHKSQSSPQLSDPLVPVPCSKSKLSIASFSLTHNKDAIKTYRRMASKTNNKAIQMTYAQYLLDVARLYSTSNSSNKNTHENYKTRETLLSEAGYWIERLAKAGHPEALYLKGKWHWHPEQEECAEAYRSKPQPLKAYKCFQAAAKTGSVDAYYELARYQKTHGEYSRAVSCYQKAATKGHTLATYKMAKILLRGQLQQKRNIRSGLEYLKKAADASGPESAEPAYVLSCVYSDELERIGIARDSQMSRKDIPLAMHYLQKATQAGLPMAVHQMGNVHEYGLLGQPQDPWQGFACYTRAAEDGYEGAMLDLSRLYAQGIPGYLMPQHQVAFKWCHRAASKGLEQAEYVLGTYYEDGIGTAPDYNRGLEWFSKAASKGYAPAAEKLNLPKNAFPAQPQQQQHRQHILQEDPEEDKTLSRLTSLRRKATFELVHQTAAVTTARAAEHAVLNVRNNGRVGSDSNAAASNPSQANCFVM